MYATYETLSLREKLVLAAAHEYTGNLPDPYTEAITSSEREVLVEVDRLRKVAEEDIYGYIDGYRHDPDDPDYPDDFGTPIIKRDVACAERHLATIRELSARFR